MNVVLNLLVSIKNVKIHALVHVVRIHVVLSLVILLFVRVIVDILEIHSEVVSEFKVSRKFSYLLFNALKKLCSFESFYMVRKSFRFPPIAIMNVEIANCKILNEIQE